VKVNALKREWPEFAAMRRLATRFRGILRSKNAAKLGVWLTDVHQSGLYAMQRFARILRRDIDAVRNAIAESWSNGYAAERSATRIRCDPRRAGTDRHSDS
jgi:transposase